ncbi:ImmA/IrrE family metallo-endopeptidase [Solimonas flava]|uniref:ImmA/IrrE family metallo-endopeptidase n=1 Tax=Solimonas flava TaxID=415849 RepID=UPI001B7FE29F|nr:ImmA/IrrE family metallo-endopeptidase [Solimonas flava]
MTTESLTPMAEANRLSAMLNLVLKSESERFPVDVKSLALECSKNRFPGDPITKIEGHDLPGFEGMLSPNAARTKWKIVYNDSQRSSGRIRFTLAHEFGHYLLHRNRQDKFMCSDLDMNDWDSNERQIESDADTFASTLLMPLDDFRRQVSGEKISFDLIDHCANRYGVSRTAAALKWIEIAPKRAILLASRDDHLLWARSNKAAYKSGRYFATRKQAIEVPAGSIAHSCRRSESLLQQSASARLWFPAEPEAMPITELIHSSGQYDYTLTLLLMPDAEWRYDTGRMAWQGRQAR